MSAKVYVSTGSWYYQQLPMMEVVRTGAATPYDDYFGCAGYDATVVGVNSIEARLPCICRGRYIYQQFFASLSTPVNGDTMQIGEYADGAVLWSLTVTRSGGVWVGAAANVFYGSLEVRCDGLSVKVYGQDSGYNNQVYSFTKTKPYGKFFIKAVTNGVCNTYLSAYCVISNATSDEILNGPTGYPLEYNSIELTNDNPEWGTQYFSIRNAIDFPVSIRFGDFAKQEWTASGKYRTNKSTSARLSFSYNLVLTDIEVAQWRHVMTIPGWNTLTGAYTGLETNYIGTYSSNTGIIESIEFGDEIEFGTGLYAAKIVVSEIPDISVGSYPAPDLSRYPATPMLSSQSRAIRSTTTHRMDSLPDQLTCKVMPRHVIRGDADYIMFCLQFPNTEVFQYTPNQGIYPFGPHLGDGPFMVRLIEATATSNTPFHWDFDITLAFESKL